MDHALPLRTRTAAPEPPRAGGATRTGLDRSRAVPVPGARAAGQRSKSVPSIRSVRSGPRNRPSDAPAAPRGKRGPPRTFPVRRKTVHGDNVRMPTCSKRLVPGGHIRWAQEELVVYKIEATVQEKTRRPWRSGKPAGAGDPQEREARGKRRARGRTGPGRAGNRGEREAAARGGREGTAGGGARRGSR